MGSKGPRISWFCCLVLVRVILGGYQSPNHTMVLRSARSSTPPSNIAELMRSILVGNLCISKFTKHITTSRLCG